jgi:hypothetical protein
METTFDYLRTQLNSVRAYSKPTLRFKAQRTQSHHALRPF